MGLHNNAGERPILHPLDILFLALVYQQDSAKRLGYLVTESNVDGIEAKDVI